MCVECVAGIGHRRLPQRPRRTGGRSHDQACQDNPPDGDVVELEAQICASKPVHRQGRVRLRTAGDPDESDREDCEAHGHPDGHQSPGAEECPGPRADRDRQQPQVSPAARRRPDATQTP